jgi:hypothetical protein
MIRIITFLIVSFFVLSFSAFVFAKDEPVEIFHTEVVGDLLWVRPLGFMNVGLGAMFYVISLPVDTLKKQMKRKNS